MTVIFFMRAGEEVLNHKVILIFFVPSLAYSKIAICDESLSSDLSKSIFHRDVATAIATIVELLAKRID